MTKAAPTPVEIYLAPLADLARRDPDIEAHVLWAQSGDWPESSDEVLDSEEMCFYAEGLLLEGFQMIWQIIGTAEVGEQAVLLMVWQGTTPPPPSYGPVLRQAAWPLA